MQQPHRPPAVNRFSHSTTWRHACPASRNGRKTRRAEHAQRTAEIVRLETDLNARVYTLFDLSAAEITIVEESTKYRYGEV